MIFGSRFEGLCANDNFFLVSKVRKSDQNQAVTSTLGQAAPVLGVLMTHAKNQVSSGYFANAVTLKQL